ncbi:hypothetical protein CYD30_18075 [Kosakonia cowanii]|nr:hypothetical protein CYD30_18075 [Kosakonia cowanii]
MVITVKRFLQREAALIAMEYGTRNQSADMRFASMPTGSMGRAGNNTAGARRLRQQRVWIDNQICHLTKRVMII